MHLAEAGWTGIMTGAYKATYVFGYIVSAMFMCGLCCAVLTRRSVEDAMHCEFM
jgi:hypothetical protein